MSTELPEPLRIGVILPTFADSLTPAFAALEEVEAAGLDGAFVYDHLWPMRHRELPAIATFPALGALAARASEVSLGTLVARVGLVDPEVLLRELVTIYECAGHRFIAGIGTGDSKAAEEFVGYGLGFPNAATRRRELRELARELRDYGVPCWIGAGEPATNAIALEFGAVLNLWGASPEAVREAAMVGPVSWAGNLPTAPDAARALVDDLSDAGARWVVFAWPGSIEPLRGLVLR